jgi:hypothetical protein
LVPIFNFASHFLFFGGCYTHVIWEKKVKFDARFISITIYKRLADVVFYFSFGLLLFNELKSKKCEGKKKRKSNHVNNDSI